MRYGFRYDMQHEYLFREHPEGESPSWDWTTDPAQATTWSTITQALEGLQRFAQRTGIVMFVLEPVTISEKSVQRLEYVVEAMR